MKTLYRYNVTAIVTIFFCFFTACAVPAAVDMGIVTGGTKGTYMRIGYDISKLVEQHGVHLKVHPSNGSLDNIADVYERKDVQLGIVQSDTLASIRSSGDSELKNITEKIRMIFPLYNEEMHLIASHSINSFADLEGKKVAIGSAGSGTALTASLLFEIAEISPGEIKYVGAKEALMLLRSEVIDAMFYIAGYPVPLLSNISTYKLHLVPIKDKRIGEYYVSSVIPAGTYRWEDGPVDTFAVKAVLMSYDYDKNHLDCKTVGKIGKIIYSNLGWLKKNGHSKWGNIELDQELTGWEQCSCVSDALKELKTAGQEDTEGGTSVKTLLRKKMTTASE